MLADNRVWLWAALLALASIVTAVLIRKPEAAPPASISFHIADAGGGLQLAWDKNAKQVREAIGGALDIKDGNSSLRVPLDIARLREGGLPYTRKSGDLEVQLTVYPVKGSPIQESARFLAPSSTAPASGETERIRRERDSLAALVAGLKQSLRKETNRNQELQRQVRNLESRVQVRRTRKANSNRYPKK